MLTAFAGLATLQELHANTSKLNWTLIPTVLTGIRAMSPQNNRVTEEQWNFIWNDKNHGRGREWRVKTFRIKGASTHRNE